MLIAFTISSAYASDPQGKKGKNKKKEVNLNIHIDKDGNVEVNGKGINEKDIEKWVEEHLNNLSINIDSNEDADAPHAKEGHEKNNRDENAPSAKDKGSKKGKTIELSITVREK
ncbi:MAG: hypothetical protein JWO03_32 [Bacteroidetes bacterium]|nr:hypothetical protein [Bacteroidota bacterium]